jgi:CheY-like chemotaxis protein
LDNFVQLFQLAELQLEKSPPVLRGGLHDSLLDGSRRIRRGEAFLNNDRLGLNHSKKVGEDQKTILVVEDDTATHMIMNAVLRRNGYKTLRASKINDLNVVMANTPLPSCMLLDIELPENVSGLKILQRIRSTNPLQTLPVIVLSARIDIATFVHAISLGADAFIGKPTSPKVLLDTISRVL